MKAKSLNGRRYHPIFIRWCLNIMLVSPLAYNIIRESGVITLPSKRTLLDYSHWHTSKTGFQNEVFEQLFKDNKVDKLNEAQRYIFNFCNACTCIVINSNSGT